jgi:hypothetical protein
MHNPDLAIIPNLPVLLFAYRRAGHFRRCWQALAGNPEAQLTRLKIFVDGAKDQSDKSAVEDTILEAQKISGFQAVEMVLAKKNLGLSNSILKGVSEVLAKEPAVIVVEDDLEVSPFFLKYMNEAVSAYHGVPKVASIHGYVYPTEDTLPETFFLKGADCWGWATWRSAWAHFEPDGKKLFKEIQKRKLEKEFNLGGVGPFTEMLKQQIAGKNDSWAIRWHASAFLAGMYTLYPGRSLVRNIGLDCSGTHCGETNQFNSNLSPSQIQVNSIPVEESQIGRDAFHEFFKTQR